MNNYTTFYVAEERAFAPGIVGEWPATIKHPTDKNGRLRRLDEEQCRKIQEIIYPKEPCTNKRKE